MENNGFILVNLLPYREKLKAEKTKQLGLLLGMFGVAALSVVVAAHSYIAFNISVQEKRNTYIKAENEKLDSNIKEIATLKEEIKETLAKRKVVESLQTNRSDGVNVLNELANQLPESSLLKSIKQDGDKITVVGQTPSNAKVSNYMSNLDATIVFNNPQLIEVKAVPLLTNTPASKNKKNINKEELNTNEFSIIVNMERKIEVEEEDSKNKKAKDNKKESASNKKKGE